MVVKMADLRAKRAQITDKMTALAGGESMTAEQVAEFKALESEVKAVDAQIDCLKSAQALSAGTARPVAGQENAKTFASVEADPYVSDDAAHALAAKKGFAPSSAKMLVLGGMVKMAANGGGIRALALEESKSVYGESHPVTKALGVSTGSAGGFIVPPDYVAEVIEFLRPAAVVRAAGPRNIPMPRGTMTLPGQNSPATASYGPEGGKVAATQQTFKQTVATYKKLTALVPVSNDMMRYADPAIDAIVRDDLVKVIALRQDKAFLLGDGTQDSPMGFLAFANRYVQANAGTIGVFSQSAASTLAVNGTDPTDTTGGNFVTSTYAYSLATVASELGGAVNRLDTAQVPDTNRVWFMHPRSYNYLYNVQNSLGVYVYRDELSRGTLLGYPVRRTTQIGANWYDASGHTNCSFVFLVEMPEAMILDSMQLELAVSREGSYIDSTGATVSAFQNDQTLIRAITEHDFQMRHDQSIAVIQGVAWAPAIS